jgi:Pyruvate/2-oxoacid:ferredoxin oxidoreductase delta subunit
VVRMPYSLASFSQITAMTKYEPVRLQKLIDGLSEKGLVMDICIRGTWYYMISPLIVGIFEFTMMRTKGELNTKEWAKLFHDYLNDGDILYSANLGHGEQVMPLRALPYEEAMPEEAQVEILDYEKATAIVEESKKFAIGICSCRHEKLHAGVKTCDTPLETCSTLGQSADYMIRHGFAREVSKTEMMENLASSKERGLVLCADNVKKDISFICHCCGCCCNVLLGISKFGFPNSVVTSTFIAKHNSDACLDCGTCVEVCPIQALKRHENGPIMVDEGICIGCGVCGLKCANGAMELIKRKQRVIHPEDSFERVVLQCLERGTLQNLFFTNPQSKTQAFMRGFIGGFLRIPPVKKALISDGLRSSFLEYIRKKATGH